MAEDCTFKRTGVCNCKRKNGEEVAAMCSTQTTEDIKGITNFSNKFLPRKRTN